MKVNYLTLLAGASLVLLSAAAARAQESAASALVADASTAPAATMAPTTTASTAPVATAWSRYGDNATYYDDCDPVRDFVVRAGAWAVHSTGSPTEIGQYQDVRQSSPFFNVEGLLSDGERSLDLSLQGDDNQTDDGRVHYFGPHLEADIDYERFEHQLYQDSYAGFATIPTAVNGAGTPPPATNNYMSRDNLSPGTDYVMRVQEFKANFKGNLTDNLKWYVNTFGMERTGERQANAVAHCFPASSAGAVPGNHFVYDGTTYATADPTASSANQCHAVSQAQHIDWQTTEVEPGIELRMGALTVNYSHMIRVFQADDQQVFNVYRNSTSLGFGTPPLPPAAPAGAAYTVAGYDIVPNTETQMDRLKAHAEVGCSTDIYALGYLGDTADELNQTNRHYEGGDLRITNKSIENLTVTGYGRAYSEHTNLQQTTLDALYPSEAQFYQQAALPGLGFPFTPQLDRDREAVGFDTRWRPFGDDCNWVRRNFAVVGGYEYGTEHYQDALGNGHQAAYGVSYGPPPGTTSEFVQPDTIKNTFSLALEEKWSEFFQTYVRFKNIETKYPFIGVSPAVDYSEQAAVNTALPTVENRVEVGGTWTACDCLMLNATMYVETASNNGMYAGPNSQHFDSNSYPFVLSAWWSPASQWSLNAGFAEMDSWINQDTTLSALGTTVSTGLLTVTPASFYNRSDVINLGVRYAWTPKLSTGATVEYVHGQNESNITVAPPTAEHVAPYNLGQYSLVQSDTYRLTLGADYIWRPCTTLFARYDYYNFQDFGPVSTTAGATNTNATGQTNMFLVGMSAKF